MKQVAAVLLLLGVGGGVFYYTRTQADKKKLQEIKWKEAERLRLLKQQDIPVNTSVIDRYNNMEMPTVPIIRDEPKSSIRNNPRTNRPMNDYKSKLINTQTATISNRGMELIKKSEGFRAKPYLDQAQKWTIGYGHLIKANEQHLLKANWSKEKAREVFLQDARIAIGLVKRTIKVPITQALFDSLISFAFNTGTTGNKLRNTINAKRPISEIIAAMKEWKNVTLNGKKVSSRGLIKRRQDEIDNFV